MGLDLTLLLVESDLGTWGYAHSQLSMDRDSELFDDIEDLKPHERPTFKLSSHYATVPDGSFSGESCYGETTEDKYGNALTYVDSQELAGVIRASKTSVKNTAVGEYLALIPRTTVALYWH